MRRYLDPIALQKAARKRTTVAALLMLVVIPATILLGSKYLANQKYMLISFVILFETMAPFFMVFEHRRPRAREIVMIAMLAALTVVGNLLSFSVLPIQAGTAMVIIAGISFGPEAGFLVGALARLVCNFFQGQGMWTPWQMFCWGLLGFLAGLLFNKVEIEKVHSRNFKVVVGPVLCVVFAEIAAYISYLLMPMGDTTFWGWRLYAFGVVGLLLGIVLQRHRLPVDEITLTVFTFFTVFIIYGGIMNICTLVTSIAMPGGNTLSWNSLRVLYISGAPFDLMHAGRAAFAILLFGKPIIQKLERIKIKYGFYRS